MWADGNKQIILPEDIEISLDITNDCNLRCKHCCISAGDGLRGKDLPTTKLKEIIRKIIDLNPHLISISGGEPLIRPDFRELTNYLHMNYTGKLLLMTNAILIDDNMAQFIYENYDYVDVSIDGVDENTCSKIRGEGVFDKTLRGIQLLVANSCKVTASMVVTEDNKHLKNKFSELCEKKLGIKYMFRVFEPVGRGEINKDFLQINTSEEQQPNLCWEECEKKFVEHKLYKKIPQIFACQGAKRQFQIDHRGNLFPCASLMEKSFNLGNLLEIEDFKDYIINRKFSKTCGFHNFESCLPYNVPKCKDCNKQLLCFSCANTVKQHLKNNTIDKVCDENKNFFDLYWRYYGTC